MTSKPIDFYLYRHGETDWNRAGRLQGAADIALNELGLQQADALREFFQSDLFLRSRSIGENAMARESFVSGAVSSPLGRARATAVRALGLNETEAGRLRIDARWSETHLGQAEGLTRDELVAQFGEESWRAWIGLSEASWLAKFPGGESKGEVRDRALSALMDLVRESDSSAASPKLWTIATHGGLLRRLLHHFHPKESHPINVVNGAVFKFTFQGGGWLVPMAPIFEPS